MTAKDAKPPVYVGRDERLWLRSRCGWCMTPLEAAADDRGDVEGLLWLALAAHQRDCRQRPKGGRHAALDELVRVSEEAGLYDRFVDVAPHGEPSDG